jgi:hypothetical protein
VRAEREFSARGDIEERGLKNKGAKAGFIMCPGIRWIRAAMRDIVAFPSVPHAVLRRHELGPTYLRRETVAEDTCAISGRTPSDSA